ncbi:MAG: RHS repeat-associated core domain-containing protein [Clostridia bacterium]|nr:RHS repeat-associated core domain-containing protein [Clostridia bacterium]
MVKYIQGDVVGVYNSSGTKLVTFKYDAYGNCTVSGNTTLAQWCKIRYRGYYFDAETGFYWVQTRYYNPEWCRWISPDSLSYINPETAHGLNLYAYCGNDPVNFTDPSGHLPEWLAWLISGAAIVSGIVLCAFGVGGVLGGLLIGAGAGSIINGYTSKANGGDFTAGYIGGAISGALCGIGASVGGMAFAVASEVANSACLCYLALGVATSFTGGFAGNLAGTVYTSWHNSGFKSVDIDWEEALATSAMMGGLNIFAGVGSAMSTIAGSLGRAAIDVNSKYALRLLAGLIAGGTEATYDAIVYLLGKLFSVLGY